MYISKLKVKNIRCFDEITIDFRSNDNTCKWALILGDNGVGKTTLLRSIAMSFCGKGSISGLLDELVVDWIRKGNKTGSIRVEIDSDSNNRRPYFIETQFERGVRGGDVEISQETYPRIFPWDELFVCGYGAARMGGEITPKYPKYRVVDSVYSLFSYSKAELHDPEVVIRRIADGKGIHRGAKVLRWIDRILMLPEHSLKLTKYGLVAKGPWRRYIPFTALGDGHQATATWLLDMLGWVLLHDDSMFSREISGIVLVDEIEQHLHPGWQKTIIRLLHQQFPKLQFIASTHSPLCATGTTDLNDEECTLVLLKQADHNRVDVTDHHKPPRDRRADQVLTSYLFGLTTSSDNAVVQKIERYSQLASKTRNEKEHKELILLRRNLNNLLGTEETELQHLIANEVHKALQSKLETLSMDPTAVNFEIKRRLLELFDKE